jgi:hypothetical protein
VFETWLHTECSLTYQEIASYTPQELRRLKLGWLKRQQTKADAQKDRHGGRDLPKSREFTRQKAREWARKRN